MKRTGLLLGLLLWPGLALAAPQITENCDNYEVRGTTLFELSKQGLHGAHLGGWDRKRMVGLTDSDVQWRYTMQQIPQGCRILQAKVTVGITTSLPYWNEQDRAVASPETRGAWDHYLMALKIHEKGHRDITVKAAFELERQLDAIPVQADCDRIGELAKRTGNAVMDEHEDAQEAYDRQTRHGETQGVRLH